MSSIPKHVNGIYLRICLSAYLLAKKNTKKEQKYKRNHPKKNVPNCSSVYLHTCLPANNITAKHLSWIFSRPKVRIRT
jgi:hypothetical protein